MLITKDTLSTTDRFQLYQHDHVRLCSHYAGAPLPVVKNRADVHTQGDFHLGIQAYVFTKQAGRVKVLVTRRSEHVDIAAGKLDQVAIQMIAEDEDSTERAFMRGLCAEIGLQPNTYTHVAWHNIELKVVKKYAECADLYNREYVKLFFVFVPNDIAVQLKICSPKLTDLQWWDFEDYADTLRTSPQAFTKTAQLYVLCEELLNSTRAVIEHLAQSDHLPACISPELGQQLLRAEFYQYANGPTLLLTESRNTPYRRVQGFINGQRCMVLDHVLFAQVKDSKTQDALQLAVLTADGYGYYWQGQSLIPIICPDDFIRHKMTLPQLQEIRNQLHANLVNAQSAHHVTDQPPMTDMILSDHIRAVESYWFRLLLWLCAGRITVNAPDATYDQRLLFYMPGTFDPAHIGHVRVLLAAMCFMLENTVSPTAKCFVRGCLIPLGDAAPGPNGAIWKADSKRNFEQRYASSRALTALFAPLINSADLGRILPNDCGLSLCLRASGHSVDGNSVHIVLGDDAWVTWRAQFEDFLQTQPTACANNLHFIVQMEHRTKPIFAQLISETLESTFLPPQIPHVIGSRLIRQHNLAEFTLAHRQKHALQTTI